MRIVRDDCAGAQVNVSAHERRKYRECVRVYSPDTFKILPVLSNASLKVILPNVNQLAFLAHSIVSNLAPVFQIRFIHTVVGSEHAVIRSASSGVKS